MIPDRLQQHECRLCAERGLRRLGIAVPVIMVPVMGYPIPYYLRFNGALCHAHTASFTLAKFAEIYGPEWYEVAADGLRATRKPATNPFPDDPDFHWESFILNPNFEPAPKNQCRVIFWEPQTLATKGAHQKLGGL